MPSKEKEFSGFFLNENNFESLVIMNPQDLKDCLEEVINAFMLIKNGNSVAESKLDINNQALAFVTRNRIIKEITEQYERFITKKENYKISQNKRRQEENSSNSNIFEKPSVVSLLKAYSAIMSNDDIEKAEIYTETLNVLQSDKSISSVSDVREILKIAIKDKLNIDEAIYCYNSN